MEQSWTVDRYDVPVGDLEFWAIRRGKLPLAANGNRRISQNSRRARILTHAGIALLVAVAIGMALG